MFTPINNQRIADLANTVYSQEDVLPGPIVYCRTHWIKKRFEKLATFPSCVLVTSFSDDSVTNEMAAACPPNVKKWYSNNVMTHNPRVEAFPIGHSYSDEKEAIFFEQYAKGHQTDVNWCTMCFLRNIPRNPNPREGIYEELGGCSFITVKGGFDHIGADEFYQDMRHHTYTISPPGAGPDCHRHWEAIALGCIPIVLRSRATDILEDLPCLRIDCWAEVTEERLAAEREHLQKRFQSIAMRKLDMNFWRKKILDEARSL